MADNRKYYYLKLKENFFDSDSIVLLEDMKDGILYSNILLKLYLKSLKNGGRLQLDEHIPYTAQMIATLTRHQIGTVERALAIFQQLGLVEQLDCGLLYMTDIELMIGQSSTEAERKRAARLENKALLPPRTNGGHLSDIRPPEIEIKKEIDIKAMIGRSAKVAENTALRKQRELDALTARDRELDMLFERLYEDNVAGKIDDARFAKMSKRYEQEQGENAKKIKALRLELKKDESKRMDIDDFLETVRRYTDATTITKRMVAELIDHIEVYHAEKQDGVTNQRVVIYYNCIGAFDVPDRRKIPEADIIMETRKGVALSYAPEQVAV